MQESGMFLNLERLADENERLKKENKELKEQLRFYKRQCDNNFDSWENDNLIGDRHEMGG